MSRLQANLQKLAGYDPAAAAALAVALEAPEADPSDPVAEASVKRARSGALSLEVRARESGQGMWLHSRFDPVREADQQVQSLAMDPEVEAVIVLGGGLLHLADSLVRARPDLAGLMVVDASARVTRLALERRDLGSLCEGRVVSLCVGTDAQALIPQLQSFLERFVEGRVTVVLHSASWGLAQDFYQGVEGAIRSAIQAISIGLESHRTLARLEQTNLLANLCAYVRGAGGNALLGAEGSLAGRPAFLVGAGPSLAKNMHLLSQAESVGGVVICDATCLRLLVSEGIRPALVCAIDPLEVTRSYVQGIEADRLPVLAAIASTAPALVGAFPDQRRLFARSHQVLLSALEPDLGAHLAVEPADTVGHFMFDLAHGWGCDPLVLVGQDLAFSDGRTHGAGVDSAWGGRVEDLKVELVDVPRFDGEGNVPTTPNFAANIASYEQRIVRLVSAGVAVLNATEGGALIRGAESCGLEQALGRLPAADLDPAAAVMHRVCQQETSSAGARASRAGDRVDSLADCLEAWAGRVDRVVAEGAAGRLDDQAGTLLLEVLGAGLVEDALPGLGIRYIRHLRRKDVSRELKLEAVEALGPGLSEAARDLAPRLREAAQSIIASIG